MALGVPGLLLLGAGCEPIRIEPLATVRVDGAIAHDADADACDGCTGGPPASWCRGGTYRGRMRGNYRSEPSGACGLSPGAEEALDLELVFGLAPAGEGLLAVRGGCIRVASEAQLTSPDDSAYGHTFELAGSVDCRSGALELGLQGTYISTSVCSLGATWDRYFNIGSIRGSFNPLTQAIGDASWELEERTPLFGETPTGGRGPFTAELDDDAGPPDLAMGEECLGVVFPPDLTPQRVPNPR